MFAVRATRPVVQALGLVALTTAVIAVSAGPAEASSKPPTPFTNTTIVVQKSIGGITLGGTQASANKGFPKKDCQNGACSYSAGSGTKAYSVFFQTVAASATATPRVASISITADGFAPAAEKLKTSKGIGIGSTVHQLKKTYPKLKGGGSDGAYYLGSGDHVTTFGYDKGRINSIGMRNMHIG